MEQSKTNSSSQHSSLWGRVFTDIQVFKLNEYDWFAANSLEAALDAASDELDLPRSEIIDDQYPPTKLTYEELMKTSVLMDNSESIDLWRLLKAMKANGEKFPKRIGMST